MRRSLGKAGVSLSQLSSRTIREFVAEEAVPAYSERTELNFTFFLKQMSCGAAEREDAHRQRCGSAMRV